MSKHVEDETEARTWNPGGAPAEAAFSEEEIHSALALHMPEPDAAREAASIARSLGDTHVTGAVLNSDMLAMLAVVSPELERRVARYREAQWERRRRAWLGRARRARLSSPGAPATTGDSGREGDAGLEREWRAFRAAREAEFEALRERVAAAAAGGRSAPGADRFVQLRPGPQRP